MERLEVEVGALPGPGAGPHRCEMATRSTPAQPHRRLQPARRPRTLAGSSRSRAPLETPPRRGQGARPARAQHFCRRASSRSRWPHLVQLASTRGRQVSIVRRRLNQFLGEPDVDESTDRYQLLFDRLDKAVGVPDVEEAGYMRFDLLKTLLRMSAPAAQHWLQWANVGPNDPSGSLHR